MNSTGPIPRRRLPLKIFDLEMAFESAASLEAGMLEGPSRAYLDLETGQIVWPDPVPGDAEVPIPQDVSEFLLEPLKRDVGIGLEH